MKKKKFCKVFDQKLMLVVGIVVPLLTQIGAIKNLNFIIEAVIELTPNQDVSNTSIDRQSINTSLHGTQKKNLY